MICMGEKSSISTKEKIFNVSIELFSKKGYDNVSIREIAKHVGIKESSIYNHYSKKEDILNTIFEYYKKNMIKTKTYYENIANVPNISPKKLYHRGSEAIKNQWKQAKMKKILRLIFIELYHNEKIRKFFTEEFVNRPIYFWTSVFRILIEKKIIEEINPKKLAKRYHKYALFLIFESMILKYDENSEESDMEKMFDEIELYFNFILKSVTLKNNKNMENEKETNNA